MTDADRPSVNDHTGELDTEAASGNAEEGGQIVRIKREDVIFAGGEEVARISEDIVITVKDGQESLGLIGHRDPHLLLTIR